MDPEGVMSTLEKPARSAEAPPPPAAVCACTVSQVVNPVAAIAIAIAAVALADDACPDIFPILNLRFMLHAPKNGWSYRDNLLALYFLIFP